jgi:hypothetical protein
MLRLLLLLIVMAGVAGYFTKPDEAAHQAAAQAAFEQAREAAISSLDLGAMIDITAADLAGSGLYKDYYVASSYSVTRDNEPILKCYGAFTQVRCSLAGALAERAAKAG